VDEHEYEQIVNSFYQAAYRFALSLAQNADDASELTQETFARLLAKAGQLRDQSKVRAWLFTTLYRIFIGWKRRESNLPHFEISVVEQELPPVTPATVDQLDGSIALEALLELDERYRAPLMLFYLEEHGYREIAEILDIPVGTVMSRLSRGKALLRQVLASKAAGVNPKILPITAGRKENSNRSERKSQL
jgi:RNA polymerase sigma-70 factor (ECF subfamily)